MRKWIRGNEFNAEKDKAHTAQKVREIWAKEKNMEKVLKNKTYKQKQVKPKGTRRRHEQTKANFILFPLSISLQSSLSIVFPWNWINVKCKVKHPQESDCDGNMMLLLTWRGAFCVEIKWLYPQYFLGKVTLFSLLYFHFVIKLDLIWDVKCILLFVSYIGT